MLEEEITKIWDGDWILMFRSNANYHYKMIIAKENGPKWLQSFTSQVFEKQRSQILQTFSLIKENLSLALISESEYVRSFAELISKTILP